MSPRSFWNIGGWDRKLRNRRFQQLKQVHPSDMTGKLNEGIYPGWDLPFHLLIKWRKLFKRNPPFM